MAAATLEQVLHQGPQAPLGSAASGSPRWSLSSDNPAADATAEGRDQADMEAVQVRPAGELAQGSVNAPAWLVIALGSACVLGGLSFMGWQLWRRLRHKRSRRPG